MKRYPLLFGYRDLVEGRGFVAGVETSGRALLVEEDDGAVCLYGVSPGGLAGVGDSRREAMADFRDGYRTVLYDLAAEARDFEEFRREVERLVTEESDVEEWTEAVEDVRAGRVDAREWRKASVQSASFGVTVHRVTIGEQHADAVPPEPVHNQPDAPPLLAA